MNDNLTAPPVLVLTTTSIIVISNQIMNLLLGLSLNIFVLYLLLSGGTGAETDATFTASQCASELLLCLNAPLSIACHARTRLCLVEALGFLWGISMSSRCSFQCCVCLERYLAVVQPVTFLKYNHARYRLACTTLIWIWSLSLSIWLMTTFPRLPYTYLTLSYGAVLTVDLFCCLSILRALRTPAPGQNGNDRGVKKRAFKIVSLNVAMLVLQAVPLSAVFGARQYFASLEDFNLAFSVCMIPNTLVGFIQPLLFLHRAGKLTIIRCLN